MKHKHTNGHSKKGKSKNNRANNNQSNVSKKQEKSTDENFSEEILESGLEENETSNINSDEVEPKISNENNTEGTTEAGDTGSTGSSTSETSSNNTGETNEANDCYDEIKAKQQELLNNFKNLSDAIGFMTLTRDNINSLRIEALTPIYFTREVRPLIDALNLIAWASFNTANVSNMIQSNPFGDNKESKHSLKLCYKMNDELDDILGVLSRRIKLYADQLNRMDKNCPPFSFEEDS